MPARTASGAGPALTPRVAKADFERDGFVCPLPALSSAETAHYRARYLDFYDQHKTRLAAMKAGDRWQVNADTHFAFQWVDQLTRHPKILATVEQLLGPDILAWNTNWFVKMPHDNTFVSWHQDGAYWGCRPWKLPPRG